jgi:sugar/nucleoside kinase (ribokinase family)
VPPQEEALTVTGHADAEAAARTVLNRAGSRTQWCVVKRGGQGATLVCRKTGKAHHVQGFKV